MAAFDKVILLQLLIQSRSVCFKLGDELFFRLLARIRLFIIIEDLTVNFDKWLLESSMFLRLSSIWSAQINDWVHRRLITLVNLSFEIPGTGQPCAHFIGMVGARWIWALVWLALFGLSFRDNLTRCLIWLRWRWIFMMHGLGHCGFSFLLLLLYLNGFAYKSFKWSYLINLTVTLGSLNQVRNAVVLAVIVNLVDHCLVYMLFCYLHIWMSFIRIWL